MRTVNCEGDGIYTLQYDDTDIFTGNRDDTIKVCTSFRLQNDYFADVTLY